MKASPLRLITTTMLGILPLIPAGAADPPDEILSKIEQRVQFLSTSDDPRYHHLTLWPIYYLKATIKNDHITDERTDYSMIMQLGSSFGADKEAATLITDFKTTLEARQAEKYSLWTKKLDQFRIDNSKKMIAAKSAADIDPTLEELMVIKLEFERQLASAAPHAARTTSASVVAKQLQEYMETAALWQEYVADLERGFPDWAKDTARSLARKRYNYPPLIPRSELLKRTNPKAMTNLGDIAKASREIASQIRSLDDLEKTITELRKLLGYGSPDLERLMGEVSILSMARDTWRSGNADRNTLRNMQRINDPLLTPFRRELQINIIRQSLRLPNDAKPQKNQTLLLWVEGLAANAVAQQKWSDAIDSLELAASLPAQSQTSTYREVSLLKQVINGSNMEAIGEYELAAHHYFLALESGTKIAFNHTSTRLKEIAKNHPEAFRKARDARTNPQLENP